MQRTGEGKSGVISQKCELILGRQIGGRCGRVVRFDISGGRATNHLRISFPNVSSLHILRRRPCTDANFLCPCLVVVLAAYASKVRTWQFCRLSIQMLQVADIKATSWWAEFKSWSTVNSFSIVIVRFRDFLTWLSKRAMSLLSTWAGPVFSSATWILIFLNCSPI